MSEERRRTPRQKAEFRVAVEDPGALVIDGTVLDVSAGGLFVACDEIFEVGTLVNITASSPDQEIFAFGAEVVRVDEGSPAGIGLRFVEIGPEALVGLRKQLVAGASVKLRAGKNEATRGR